MNIPEFSSFCRIRRWTTSSQFTPTPEQERALSSPAPLLVVAGAGTGKTTVLTHRIARLIQEGRARPDQVLALTFTDKAAAEMADRLNELLGEPGTSAKERDVTTKTFHAFGDQVVRENLLWLGIDRAPAVLSGATAWQLLSSFFDDLTFDAVDISTAEVAGTFNRLLHFFSECKDHLVTPQSLEDYIRTADIAGLASPAAEVRVKKAAEMQDLAAAYRRYEDAKREKGFVDFGDLLLLPVQLFQAHPSVKAAYRRRYRYIFVDEYQDTNHAQRILLLELIDPSRPAIMVIGDDDQAIYRWRGAIVHNILKFPEEEVFARGRVTTLPMTQNRRSAPPILDLAHLVIGEVRERHPKKLGYREDGETGQATVGHYVAASDRLEAEWIAARIGGLHASAHELPGKKHGFGAFAILCRRRSLFEPLGRALEAAGIPYELIGGTGFYGRWEIRDILSYLRVLASTHGSAACLAETSDDLALARILRSRRLRLASRDLFHLGQWVRQQNGDRGSEEEGRVRVALLDAVLRHEEVTGLSGPAVARLAALRQELQAYSRDCQRLSLAEILTRVIEGTGYRRELLAEPGFDAKMALLNLAKLEDMARQFEEATEGGGLGDFIEFVAYAVESGEEEGEVRPAEEESDSVKIMTIHQSKGLEFPVVFIPGLGEGMFPSRARSESDTWHLPRGLRGDRVYVPHLNLAAVQTKADLQRAQDQHKQEERRIQLDEERRLFYVAITRAQRHLYFSRAHWYGSRKSPSEPSIFWETVAGCGLSLDLGQAQRPDANPNLHPDHTVEMTKSSSTGPEPAGLLLEEGDPSGWIESTAQQEGHERWIPLKAEAEAHIARLVADRGTPVAETGVDITCSGLVHYLTCPRAYRYVYVDHLPTRPSWRATRGVEVHRRIEELSRSIDPTLRAPLDDAVEDELDDREHHVEELPGTAWQHVSTEEMVAHFQASIYARRPATYVELPFSHALPAGTLRGRIDRLDQLPDGRWEVIDFKSGRATPEATPGHRRQLGLYTLAVRQIWQAPADRIEAHLFFLHDATDVALGFTDTELDELREEANAALRSIGREEFGRTRNEQDCSKCPYNHLCHLPTEQSR
ncbi:MAG: UvrD-helicase domain-containing protein [Chloroflexi bacterium]|nr:UvrD-helicase domain-containing protein [Chloroflexota bacterium]